MPQDKDTERRISQFYSELEPIIEKLLTKLKLSDLVVGVNVQIEVSSADLLGALGGAQIRFDDMLDNTTKQLDIDTGVSDEEVEDEDTDDDLLN